MSAPTTSIFLNSTSPPAPEGNQNVKPQTDGATPMQSITFYPQIATAALLGVVKPGTGISIDGTGTMSADAPASAASGVLGVVIDGGGSVPATGSKGVLQVPYDCTITGWTMLADQSGSAQITVSAGSFSAFPAVASIVAAAPPNLSAAQKATSTTLTGWTASISAGDVLSFNLDSVASCQRIILELQVTKL